jgi:CBS-domain-containing membrane protein
MAAMSHSNAGQASETLDRLLGSVGDAMRAEVLALTPETPGDVAARRLERAGIAGAPVVRHGRVVGVVTLRDLLAAAIDSGAAQTTGPFLRYDSALRDHEVVR